MGYVVQKHDERDNCQSNEGVCQDFSVARHLRLPYSIPTIRKLQYAAMH